MSFLVTCRELFDKSPYPILASSVNNRRLVQTEFHRHEFFEIIYVAKGSLQNDLSTGKMSLQAGDLLIIKPYVRHLLKTYSDNPIIKAYCCSFLPGIVDSSIKGLEDVQAAGATNKYFFKSFLSLANDDASATLVRIPKHQRPVMEKLFRSVEDASGGKTDASFARLRCHFLDLLATLSDLYVESLGQSGGEALQFSQITTSRHHEGLRKSLNHMHSHFSEPISLNDMAKMSGVSVSYFSLLMTHATGMSFVKYLNGLRMDQACSLLRGSNESIMDICYSVGFNDYSHFSRKFKELQGLTPRQYRMGSEPESEAD